jgi:uracil-DNA glycosylase
MADEEDFSEVNFDDVPEKIISRALEIINTDLTKIHYKQSLKKTISWNEICENEFNLLQLNYHHSWNNLFKKLFSSEKYNILLQMLVKYKKYHIEPKLNLLFNAFDLTSFDDVKVVFLGIRPHNESDGLAFSTYSSNLPSSSRLIFNNQLIYNQINKFPTHSNLKSYAKQGCLMLNSELISIKVSKESGGILRDSVNEWKWFINGIIKHISDMKVGVVFVIWGLAALEFVPQIDAVKHHIIISSYPSGLTYNRKMKSYEAFNEINHFGKINELLESHGKTGINWQLD